MPNLILGRLFSIVSILILAGCASLPPSNICKELQGDWEGQWLPQGHQVTVNIDDSCYYTVYGPGTGMTGHIYVDSGGGLTYYSTLHSGGGVITYTTEGQRKRLVWRRGGFGSILGRYTIDVTKK